jgi:hypothetical protein
VGDLNSDNIGTKKNGVTIEGGESFAENARRADAVFATGWAVVNGTIDATAKVRPDTVFYSMAIAGIACLKRRRQCCYIAGTVSDAACGANHDVPRYTPP